jgi:hypothetical protein
MQSTGHTSTQAVSFVPTHGSQMMYAIYLIILGVAAAGKPSARLARDYNSGIGMLFRTMVALLLGLVGAARAAAQIPSEPLVFGGGRVTIGADVSASFGGEDPGFFNYTDYDHSALRTLRIDVTGAVTAGRHLTLLGEMRSENVGGVVPYALYVRFRPWADRNIDINAGRVPPTFGAFARRTYASDNPLIGYPLAYQYLTSLRPDAIPANADELLSKQSLGWRLRYTVGDTAFDRGVPLVSAFRWDTGVQAHAGALNGVISATASMTTGTLSNPLFSDDNNGRQFAGRIQLRPVTGLIVGTSAAHGPFITDALARSVAVDDAGKYTQSAWGADAEYSRAHYLVRFETILSAWQLPLVHQPALDLPLRAVSASLEGRYKITPAFYAAARLDHLGFSDVVGTQVTAPWDAPVTRVEVGGGYSILRNLQAKASVQRDVRDGGRLRRRAILGAAQLVFWF